MLGENIKTYRQKKGYTQEEVANRLHVTRQTISKWKKKYSVPDAEVLVKLADVLLLCITKMTVSTQALTLFIRWSQCLIYRQINTFTRPKIKEPMVYVNYCEKSDLGNPRCQKLSDLDSKTVEQDKAWYADRDPNTNEPKTTAQMFFTVYYAEKGDKMLHHFQGKIDMEQSEYK